MLAVMVLVTVFGPLIAPYDPSGTSPDSLAGPGAAHWLGTDSIGRDVLSRLIIGGRTTLLITFVSVALAVAGGLVLGLFSGYVGGPADQAIMRFLTIAIVYTPRLARVVRGPVLSVKRWDHVEAARSVGVGELRIAVRHVLPNSLTPVVTFLPFRMSGAILALTSLDFLGLGVPPGTPSLGELLSQGKNNIDAWWISLSTFAVLVITLLLLTFMGDALRDALDPRKADLDPVPASKAAP